MGFVTFEMTYDAIQRSVKQETSHYAKRATDDKGSSLFEELVMDEAYDEKCRELFNDAKARMLSAMSAYTRDVPVAPGYVDETDRDYNIDFIQTLDMPNNWNWQLLDSVNAAMKEFFVSYISYRWFETKRPADADVYNRRSVTAIESIVGLLNKRVRPIRRPHSWY